ncbi:MAG TPA: hypothetical protein VMI75_34700 [Polyangiaceae bacterium]|nr:hypothetical protein [Polyangiaceae bacterium]
MDNADVARLLDEVADLLESGKLLELRGFGGVLVWHTLQGAPTREPEAPPAHGG